MYNRRFEFLSNAKRAAAIEIFSIFAPQSMKPRHKKDESTETRISIPADPDDFEHYACATCWGTRVAEGTVITPG